MTYLPASGKNFMSIGYLPSYLRDTNYTGFRNVDPSRTSAHGFNYGSIKLAKAHGYSDRQIKTALQQWGQWGNTLGGTAVTDWMKTVGPVGDGLHAYQSTHGGFGIGEWDAAIAAGIDPEDLRESTTQVGQPWSRKAEDAYYDWRDDQAEQRATQQIQQAEAKWEDRIKDVPTVEDLVAAMPEPKIRAGRDYATSGRSAQGMRIKRGTKFAEGGKRGTKGYFGRGAKFTGTTAPSMNIGGTSNQGGSQANNTLNTA